MLLLPLRNMLLLAFIALLFGVVTPVRGQSNSGFDAVQALNYAPSKVVGAIGFTVYFIISSLILWRIIRNRDWWSLCLPIGGYAEAAGFMLRVFILEPKFRFSRGYFIAMYLLIVLSPATFLAFNYITYGRLVLNCVGREHSFIRPERIGRFFVISDIFTFLVQATGGSTDGQIGTWIFLGGIAAQGLSYVIYVCLVSATHRSIRKSGKSVGLDPVMEEWWKIFKLLYFSSFFILIRSTYRVIEAAQGDGSYLLTHEWCFLVLDSVPLAIAIGIYIFFWPGAYTPKSTKASRSNSIASSTMDLRLNNIASQTNIPKINSLE